jgi:hypothetical protein
MTDKFFGTHVVIKEDVKYVGDGEDPKNDPFFVIWQKALEAIHSKEKT